MITKEKIKFAIIDSIGFIKSYLIVTFRTIKRPAIFYGYNSYEFALKYKAKRENGWLCKWDQMGRKQAILPYNDTSLIVCSTLELKIFKKKGYIKTKVNPRKLIKKSY